MPTKSNFVRQRKFSFIPARNAHPRHSVKTVHRLFFPNDSPSGTPLIFFHSNLPAANHLLPNRFLRASK